MLTIHKPHKWCPYIFFAYGINKWPLNGSCSLEKWATTISKLATKDVLEKDISNVKSLYEFLGFNRAEIDAKFKEMSNNQVEVFFFVNKGERLKITAEKYALEICSNFSYPVIYLYDKVLNWFWNSRYEGLHSMGLEKIKDLEVGSKLDFEMFIWKFVDPEKP